MAKPLPKPAILGFALGSLGSGVYSTVPTVLLLFYCTEVLHIPPAFAAAIVFIPKAWAIVWDPLVGAWSDRSRSPRGRRAPFILAGTVGISLTFALLFNAPGTSTMAAGGYVMLVYFVMSSSYSVFAVPYVAVPAEITDIAAEREQLMAWRMTTVRSGNPLARAVRIKLELRTSIRLPRITRPIVDTLMKVNSTTGSTM